MFQVVVAGSGVDYSIVSSYWCNCLTTDPLLVQVMCQVVVLGSGVAYSIVYSTLLVKILFLILLNRNKIKSYNTPPL
jgi:hypothetical protein